MEEGKREKVNSESDLGMELVRIPCSHWRNIGGTMVINWVGEKYERLKYLVT